MTQFVPAGESGKDRARVCITGEPGMGKTRLAATFPHPLFLDAEVGAATALPGGVNRVIIETDKHALRTTRELIERISAGTRVPEGVLWTPPAYDEPVTVGTVVLDSIDAIQAPAKMAILRGRTKMTMENWDELLNVMQPLVLAWNALPTNLVVVAHCKRSMFEGNRPDATGFAVQGSLRAQLPRWFSQILHIGIAQNGSRFVIAQPITHRGVRYAGKARHGALDSLVKDGIGVPLANNDGYPDDAIAKAVCGL